MFGDDSIPGLTQDRERIPILDNRQTPTFAPGKKMNHDHLSEHEQLRREHLAELQRLGINPYPAEEFLCSDNSANIKKVFDETPAFYEGKTLRLAGRIMMTRDMGKAAFVSLQDESGRIQLYIRRDDICPTDDKSLYDIVFKKLIDLGDFIGVEGFVFRTKTGEVSVHVQSMKILSKALKPLPVVKEKEGVEFDAVTDPEFRYRQRYADMVINPHVREVFFQRSKIVKTMRDFMEEKGYL